MKDCITCMRMVKSFLMLLRKKSETLYMHSIYTGNTAGMIAAALEFEPDQMRDVQTAGFLHDIGKLCLPDGLLLKDSNLTSEEFGLIKTHSKVGSDILRGVFKNIPIYILYHHEAYDGSGYPEGLKSSNIPIPAKVLGIADRYTALISQRSYRAAYSRRDALREVEKDIKGFFNGNNKTIEKVLLSLSEPTEQLPPDDLPLKRGASKELPVCLQDASEFIRRGRMLPLK